MTVGDRVKELRFFLKLSQKTFGEKIGISAPSVARIESGENNPAERTIRLICQEFSVSYAWLKEGIGEMIIQEDEDDAVNRLMLGQNEFAKQVFRALAKLPPECWEAFRQFAEQLKKEKAP